MFTNPSPSPSPPSSRLTLPHLPSLLAWPAWLRVAATVPALGLLWLGVLWAGAPW